MVVLLGDAALLDGAGGTLSEALTQDQFLRTKFAKSKTRLCLLQTGEGSLNRRLLLVQLTWQC